MVTIWSENTRPKPGFFSSSARFSAETGDGCGTWANESDEVVDVVLDIFLSTICFTLSQAAARQVPVRRS
jgi:hypothetical protein